MAVMVGWVSVVKRISQRLVGADDPDMSRTGQCLQRIDEKVGQQLTEQEPVRIEFGERGRELGDDRRLVRAKLSSCRNDGFLHQYRHGHAFSLEADRSHKLEYLDDDSVRHLGFVDDVTQELSRVR